MLSSFGAEQVEMASTAEDALTKCKFDYYDVILCDFNLGSGKNGQQILEELRVRKRLKHTHLFIMITAETAKDVVLGAREYQPDGYIAKPITRTVLEQRLGHLLIQQRILKPINKEIDLENYSKAITLCHKLLEEKSKYQSWCYQTLAKLYSLIGDNASAAQIYRDVLASRDIPWARIGMGQTLHIEQQYHEAKDCFRVVIEEYPNMIEAYDGIAQSYLKLGRSKESQEALQQAVNLSPRMVLRQEKLGKICQQNQDIEAATNAYRMAVQYGENSIHEKVDHYLNLGRCLAEWCEGDTSEQGRNRALEAVQILDKASGKFSTNDEACINALLIEARIHQGQGDSKQAAARLHQAECMIEEESLSPDIGIELAKTLYAVEQPERAEKLLLELSKRFADDPEAIAKIGSLLDEPESLECRRKAKDLNKTGIIEFEQGHLEQAIESFRAALAYTPKHAALNLNLVQVLIKQYKDLAEHQYLTSASAALEKIKHIPEQHHQYKRLQYLKKSIAKLNGSDTPQRPRTIDEKPSIT